MTGLYHDVLKSVFNNDKLTFNYESQDRFEKAACLLSDAEIYDLVIWVKPDLIESLFLAHGLTVNGLDLSIEESPDHHSDGFVWSLSDSSSEIVNGLEFNYSDCIQSAIEKA